jgi:hypothetical protein
MDAIDTVKSVWSKAHEGFLAVATPCCSEASLWDALDTTTADGQRARAASLEEVAEWLDLWPYRSREEQTESPGAELRVGLQGSEVRCYRGEKFGGVPPHAEDILRVLQLRTSCQYSKWKAWTPDTAKGRLPERHTVWADDNGHFHGLVQYKRGK